MIHKLLKGGRFPIRPHVFFILLICAFLSCPVSTHAQAQLQNPLSTKNVLILHSHEASAPVFIGTDKGLLATLESGGIPRLNQCFKSLDLRQNPGPEYRRILVEEMRVRYSHRKLDIIITMYPEALEFVLKDCREIFPDVPILALYLPQGFGTPKTDRPIIGHSASLDISGTLEIALKLVPEAKRVYVVSGAHQIDRSRETQARRDLKKWEGRLEFRYLSGMPFEDMLTVLSTAPPDTVVLLLIYTNDPAGRGYTAPNLTRQLSQVSTAPIFGLLEVALGYGITGGSLINFKHIGAKAGELVLDILGGAKSPDNVSASLEVPPIPMFDWQQLRRWKLSEAALPKGSIVINRESTLWDHRYYIIGALAFCLAQTLLILYLIVQTRRKRRAEDSTIDAEGKYRRIFDGALEGIFEASAEGRCLTANPAVVKMLGYETEDEVRLSITDSANQLWVDPGERAKFTRLIEEQDVVLGYETKVWRKDRTTIWVSISGRRVRGPDGKTLLYSAFVEDISERKRAEDEIARSRAELLRVQRLTHLSELTASLSHELNQPLAAILSSAQAALRFLKSAPPDLDLFRTILENIVEDNKRAAGVIRSLRSLVKKEVKEKEPLNMNEVLEDFLPLFHSEAIIRNVEIKTDIGSSLPPVCGDKAQLQQVLFNLVMNATEAMSQIPSQQRRIILGTHATDNHIQVTVRDFGPGIDSAKLRDIWQPFFTTKATGLGIGLSVCNSIIQGARRAYLDREQSGRRSDILIRTAGDENRSSLNSEE